MKHIDASRGRATAARPLASYRPCLEGLEARLPMGDTLLGVLLGTWWAQSLVSPAPLP
jgi:hypothetical protein